MHNDMFYSEFWADFEMMNKTTHQGLPYDVRSIMHYPPFLHSSNGRPNFIPLRPFTEPIGTALIPSYYDYLHINLLYCQGTLASNGINYCLFTYLFFIYFFLYLLSYDTLQEGKVFECKHICMHINMVGEENYI